jgi:uncharacterized membrane protein
MKKSVYTLSFVFLIVAINACSKENEQALQPKENGSCDTSNISYSVDVKPVLQKECYACHSTSIASGGIVLDNYNGVKAASSAGRLAGAVSHAAGYVPMPLGQARISDCSVNTIKAWINRGMINN